MITLYAFIGSNSCATADAILKYAELEHRRVNVLPGLHAVGIRLRGFGGQTVPAMRVGNKKVLGSRAICHEVAQLRPELNLLPEDPVTREHVLAAEALGERLQNALRRTLYVNAANDISAVRAIMQGAGYGKLPAPLLNTVSRVIRFAAQRSHKASPKRLDADLAFIVDTLNQVDAMVDAGLLGSDNPNVADFQFAPNISAFALSPEVAPMMKRRPSWKIAEKHLPAYPLAIEIQFPPEQLAMLNGLIP